MSCLATTAMMRICITVSPAAFPLAACGLTKRLRDEVLRAIEGNAVEAAVVAAEQMEQQRQELRKSLELEVEQARYEARLAARRYESVDPEQRLVAAELEARWNTALQKKRDLEDRLEGFDRGINQAPVPNKELLLSLAQDLPAIWNSPSTDMRLKQRIVRILIEEIVVDVDDEQPRDHPVDSLGWRPSFRTAR